MADNDKVIRGFRGEYFFLSNMYPTELECNGLKFPSAEHAYQYSKLPFEVEKDEKYYKEILKMSPKEVKKWGQTIPIRKDWDEIKTRIMDRVVTAKFRDNDELFEKMIKLYLDGYEFEETNDWGDTFWGVCNGVGENYLGEILKKVSIYCFTCKAMEAYGETSYY